MRQSATYTVLKWCAIIFIVLLWMDPPSGMLRLAAEGGPHALPLAGTALVWAAAGYYFAGALIDAASKQIANLMRMGDGRK